jgi:hypothetical protein
MQSLIWNETERTSHQNFFCLILIVIQISWQGKMWTFLSLVLVVLQVKLQVTAIVVVVVVVVVVVFLLLLLLMMSSSPMSLL